MALNQVSPGCVLCVYVCNYTSNANSLMKKIDVQKEIKFTYNYTLVNILVGPDSQEMGLCVTNSFVTEFFLLSLKYQLFTRHLLLITFLFLYM